MAKKKSGSELPAIDPRATFFPKKRTRVELTGWSPKRNAENEKRVKIDLTLPLIDKTRDHVLPAWIIEPLAAMERPESAETEVKLNTVLEGVTIEFFDTAKSPERINFCTAATLQDFVLKRVTRDSQTFPALCFNTNIKRAWTGLRFLDKYEGMYVWADFTPADPAVPSANVPGSQMTMADAAGKGEAKGKANGAAMPTLDEERQEAIEAD